jgi:NAD-dependent SIR2 family protein deacetylase
MILKCYYCDTEVETGDKDFKRCPKCSKMVANRVLTFDEVDPEGNRELRKLLRLPQEVK